MATPKLTVANGDMLSSPATRVLPGIGRLVEQPEGLDWCNPNIAVKEAGALGLGLVCLDFIPKGSTIILFGGKLMSWKEISQLPEDMQDIPYQVTDDIFFGIPLRNDIGTGERINHSCDPNCGFLSEMKLVAIRDIMPGQDVTMDYACCSTMSSYRLVCLCNSKNCRKIITGNDWKLPYLQKKLRGYFQPYIQEKINRQSPSLRSKLASLFFTIAKLLNPSIRYDNQC